MYHVFTFVVLWVFVMWVINRVVAGPDPRSKWERFLDAYDEVRTEAEQRGEYPP